MDEVRRGHPVDRTTRHPGIEVTLVWDPPWTPDKMTGAAREHFGWLSGSS